MKRIISILLVAVMLVSVFGRFSAGAQVYNSDFIPGEVVLSLREPHTGSIAELFPELDAIVVAEVVDLNNNLYEKAKDNQYISEEWLGNVQKMFGMLFLIRLADKSAEAVLEAVEFLGQHPNVIYAKPNDIPDIDNPTIPSITPQDRSGSMPTAAIAPDAATPSFSGYAEALAKELHKLGLFIDVGGGEGGNPIFDLGSSITRLQALILAIRLLGLEDEALGYTDEAAFSDVPDWGAPYVAFGFDKGITNGTSATTFSPNQNITCQQFTAFMVRILGYYEKGGDFTYADTLAFALSIGLFDEALLHILDEGTFLRSKSVVSMTKALTTCINGSNEIKLIDTLVGAEVISEESALAFQKAIEA